jgi:putative ABC transport system permease protein
MLKNYLMVAIRNLLRHKGYSFINIGGLAIGMACCILIMLWVVDELSYDAFHENADRLFRVTKSYEKEGEQKRFALTPAPLGPALKEQYPEIVNACRVIIAGNRMITYEDKSFSNDILAYADPEFLEMFSYPLVVGDKKSVLNDKYAIVISESMSQKYFGGRSPIGKSINVDRREFSITGVFKDIHENSHLKFDCLAQFDPRTDWIQSTIGNWDVSAFYNYVLLDKHVNYHEVENKISDIVNDHRPDHENSVIIGLQPIKRIHLYHDVEDYLEGHGDIKNIYLFSLLALLILIIACINFINLSTARSTNRAKEVGVRKVIGAGKTDLIRQFLGESLILAFAAMILAIAIVESMIPVFESWSGKNIKPGLFSDLPIILGLIGIIGFVGIIAGAYPAFVLSSFKPMKILSGHLKSGNPRALVRKILVVTQFALSAFLIFGTLVIYNQLSFINNKNLGFDKGQLIYFDMRGKFQENYENIRLELLQNSAITEITAGAPPIESFDPAINISWEGKVESESGDEMIWQSLTVDNNYLDVLGMEIIDGAGFRKDENNQNSPSIILNETAARKIGFDSPVGKQISFSAYKGEIVPLDFKGTIIGVVKDFHFESVHRGIEPVIIHLDRNSLYSMIVKIRPGMIGQAIELIKNAWSNYASEYPLEYHFIDQTIESYYDSDKRFGKVFEFCSLLAIFISCLGLFGLAAYIVEQRRKEIGIRKVLGASLGGIIGLLSFQYVWLVILANLIAAPPAYIAMNSWLKNFVYRIDVGWPVFPITALLTLFIALAVIVFQAAKGALTNPVNALRHE